MVDIDLALNTKYHLFMDKHKQSNSTAWYSAELIVMDNS